MIVIPAMMPRTRFWSNTLFNNKNSPMKPFVNGNATEPKLKITKVTVKGYENWVIPPN